MELHSHKAKDSWSPESWLSKGLSPSLSERALQALAVGTWPPEV